MIYCAPWLKDCNAREVLTVIGFGTLWHVTFGETAADEDFEPGVEEDMEEVKAEKISKSFQSRFLVVGSGGKEIWTSDEELAMKILGVSNSLFAA